jgi:hypothetical protein
MFAQAAEQFGYLEALGATLRAIAAELRLRLPADIDSMANKQCGVL